jgi:hypothetical protein
LHGVVFHILLDRQATGARRARSGRELAGAMPAAIIQRYRARLVANAKGLSAN